MSEHAATHDHAAEGHDAHAGPHHSAQDYIKIWGVLVVLLAISVAGPFLGIQVITLLTAFGIAFVKAFLVCKHFMHLDVQPKYVLYFLGTALAFMALFFFAVAPDVMHHEGQNWVNVSAQAEIERALAEQGHGAGGAEVEGFDAAATFETTCGLCHGAGGAGDGAAAASLDPHPANFTDPEFWANPERTHEHIVATITSGGASVGRSAAMPAFGTQYTEEQIEALAAHVESLNPNAGE